MAEEQDQSQKTEDPTQRRLEQAHEEGDVVTSQEVVTFALMAASAALLLFMAGPMARDLAAGMKTFIAAPHELARDGPGLVALLSETGWWLVGVLAAPLGLLMAAGVAGNVLQHRPVFTASRLKPELSRVSPLKGFERLFGMQGLVQFAKGTVKVLAVGAIVGWMLWQEWDSLALFAAADPAALPAATLALLWPIAAAVIVIVGVLAAGDYLYQRFEFLKRHRMSREQLKEEFKETEGDPHIRARLRQIRAERGRSRMMAAVPTATVVVANPTHYAVALKYDQKAGGAPVCVAKGVDAVALRIRAVAEGAGVPVVENPPLARALYAGVDLEQQIPVDHYQAVAQVIGFVMRQKGQPRR